MNMGPVLSRSRSDEVGRHILRYKRAIQGLAPLKDDRHSRALAMNQAWRELLQSSWKVWLKKAERSYQVYVKMAPLNCQRGFLRPGGARLMCPNAGMTRHLQGCPVRDLGSLGPIGGNGHATVECRDWQRFAKLWCGHVYGPQWYCLTSKICLTLRDRQGWRWRYIFARRIYSYLLIDRPLPRAD